MEIIVFHFFFAVGHFQEFTIQGIHVVTVELEAQFLKAVSEGTTSAAGCQYDLELSAPTSSGLMIS